MPIAKEQLNDMILRPVVPQLQRRLAHLAGGDTAGADRGQDPKQALDDAAPVAETQQS